MKSKHKILLISVLIVFFVVIVYPALSGRAVYDFSIKVTNTSIAPDAQVGIVNYNRNEAWSYTCPEESPICPGAGGTGKTILTTSWSAGSGGKLIDTDVTAPRYGSQTCTRTVIWSPTLNGFPSPTEYPVSVDNSCEGKTYTREMCLGADTNEDKLEACSALAVYGAFEKYIVEKGKGSSSTHVVLDNYLTRDMKFSVNTRTLLRVRNAPRGLYNVTLLVKAYELKDYPPGYNAVERQLGWKEYTVAGKRVGKSSSDAYQVTLQITNGELIDVTPKANVPLYIFSITPLKTEKIPDNRNLFQKTILHYLT